MTFNELLASVAAVFGMWLVISYLMKPKKRRKKYYERRDQ
jgi:hypothetical protein